MGDVVGRLFREFAITLAVAILISARRLAHAHADDVRAPAAAHAARAAGPLLPRQPARWFDRDHRALRRDARLGARPPARDAARSRSRTLVLTVVLYIVIPKGFFPVQDTGVIQGISEAPQSISSRRWPSASRRSPQVDPRGPGGREPVVVHRRRRHQHDAEQRPHADQPEAARRARRERRSRSSGGCSATRDASQGITLYMQPVQDLTIEDRVSRTQYQFTLENAESATSSRAWVPRLVERLRAAAAARRRRERPAGPGPAGLRRRSTATPRRASASRRRRSTTRSTTPSASA